MESDFAQQVGTWVAAGTAAVAGTGGAVAVLRRRLSRDRTEMTKDRVEREFFVLLLKERDDAIADAREAWRAQQADAVSIARLSSQNAAQQAEIERLRSEFIAMRRQIRRLYPVTQEFLESDFAAPNLDPSPTPHKP